MDADELKRRTKAFALKAIELSNQIPQNPAGLRISGQFIGATTSVAANYRAACRGRSKAEFVSKLQTCLEEADESALWAELLTESGLVSGAEWSNFLKEANELTAIFTSSLITARGGRRDSESSTHR